MDNSEKEGSHPIKMISGLQDKFSEDSLRELATLPGNEQRGNFMMVLQRSKENGDQMLPTATRGREGGNWPQGGHLFLGRLFKGSGHV